MNFYGGMMNLRNKISFFFAKNGFWKNYIGFEIDAFLRKLRIGGGYKKYKGLKKLKNIHKGERCFILATGPSLRKEDAEALKNEYTFGVNSIFKLYGDTDWRPTYYAMCDYKVYKSVLEINPELNFDDYCKKCAFVSDSMDLTKLKANKPEKICVIPFSYLNHMFTAEYVTLKYSSDIIHGLYNMLTVTNFCINIAQYMGFKEIYLLGVDFSYSSKQKKQHFDGSRNMLMDDDVIRQSVIFNTERSYKLAKKCTEKSGICVYNATRGGKLEVFKRVDFDSLNLK